MGFGLSATDRKYELTYDWFWYLVFVDTDQYITKRKCNRRKVTCSQYLFPVQQNKLTAERVPYVTF